MKKVICDHAGECNVYRCEHLEPHNRYVDHDIFTCDLDLCEVLGEHVHCVEAPDDNH